jgi:dihydroflavonol-4-reductase
VRRSRSSCRWAGQAEQLKVLITGGTGFIGAHTVKAVVDAGHEVRLLVRNPARIEQSLVPLGVHIDDFVVGDIKDEASVAEAMTGCDAVIHAAAEVSVERRRAADVLATNPRGTEIVIDGAIARGLDPIVHVSSVAALFTPGVKLVHADLSPAKVHTAYSQSKARAEEHVRKRQAEGAPIVITYPAAVWGPPAGQAIGESIAALEHYARSGLVMSAGALSFIDVRDLAAIHAAVLTPGRGPRRYMCGGHFIRMRDYARLLHDVTGRRFRVLPTPEVALRVIGTVMDGLMRALPIDSPLTHEGMTLLTRWVPTDDSAFHEDLRVELRERRETVRDAIRGLVALGRLTTEQAGNAAAPATAL